MLHILTHNNPFSLKLCQQAIKTQDSIIFIDEAVYLLLNLEPISATIELYALKNDILARGLNESITFPIHNITMAEFVELTEKYTQIQNW